MKPLYYIILNSKRKVTGVYSQNITSIKIKTKYTKTLEHYPVWEGTCWRQSQEFTLFIPCSSFLNFGYCISVIEFLLGSYYTFQLSAANLNVTYISLCVLNMITLTSFSDNSIISIPCGSVSIICCCYGLELHCLISWCVWLVLIEWWILCIKIVEIISGPDNVIFLHREFALCLPSAWGESFWENYSPFQDRDDLKLSYSFCQIISTSGFTLISGVQSHCFNSQKACLLAWTT